MYVVHLLLILFSTLISFDDVLLCVTIAQVMWYCFTIVQRDV